MTQSPHPAKLIAGVWVCLLFWFSIALGDHNDSHTSPPQTDMTDEGSALVVPGASFRVYVRKDRSNPVEKKATLDLSSETVQTIVKALTFMVEHRKNYRRFDEALSKNALAQVIIEPKVLNREGKEFFLLVARTQEKGKVKLLISAHELEKRGFLHHSEKLVPALAREFQWVVSKADTTQRPKRAITQRNLKHAPIHSNKAIRTMSPQEREQALQALFQSYLTTVDDFSSLTNQPYYDVGSTKTFPPDQPDSTTKLYDIRIREALQLIVQDPHFQKRTPKAVRALLNGKIWNVSVAKIESRDWATRTRVVPEDKSVVVGERAQTIQPAKILVNLDRFAAPDDPFFAETKGLPMGALSTEQLATVIALEIQHNIIEKSMSGHVAQDELTTPK